MKTRSGFVSNSSSTSFIITNKTNSPIPWCEFVRETKHVVIYFIFSYYDVSGRLQKYIRELENDSEEGDNAIGEQIVDADKRFCVAIDEILDEMCRECNGVDAIQPGDMVAVFGDEDGTLIGEIYDYSLRDGGETNRFRWRLHEYLR